MLPPKGLSFTANKKFAAIAERKDAKDIVGIYYAGNEWKMVQQIETDTFDLKDVKWTNGDSAILVWDTALDPKILIYSVATGDLINKFEPEVVGLGIKSLTIAPNESMISAGLYDDSIVLYNILSAQEIASLSHIPKIDLNQKSSKTVYVYQEETSSM